MKKHYFPILLISLTTCLNSCSVVGGIFKAGAVVGTIAVVVIIAVITWIISLFRGKSQ